VSDQHLCYTCDRPAEVRVNNAGNIDMVLCPRCARETADNFPEFAADCTYVGRFALDASRLAIERADLANVESKIRVVLVHIEAN